ncbi:MAG: hypothetical protein QXM71_07505 [Thermofilum sp.]
MSEVCPRCGLPGYRSVEKRGGREYVYYIHTSKSGSRKCYIGPMGRYTYVEHMHVLSLQNIESVDYYEVALNALRNYVRRVEKEMEKRPQLRNELISKIDRLIEILERLKARLIEEGRA